MIMKGFMNVVIAVILALAVAGCSTRQAGQRVNQTPPSVVEQPIKKPTAIPQTTDQPGLYMWDSRSGIPALDEVIAQIAQPDLESLTKRLQYANRPCPVAGVNGPIPCDQGKTDGSLMPVFPYYWCGPTYLDPLAAADTLRRYIASAPSLYAVYQLNPGSSFGLGEQYVILMAQGIEDSSALLLYLNPQGQIVTMRTGCGKPGAVAPPATSVTYLLPPLAGQEAKAEQTAYLTGHLQSEATTMLEVLRYATGETECYGLDCSKPNPLAIAKGLKERIDGKVDPASTRQAGGFDQAIHGRLLEAIEFIAQRMTEITQDATPPSDAAILAALNEAKERLRGVLAPN